MSQTQNTNPLIVYDNSNSPDKESSVVYGFLKHPLAQTIYIAMRNTKLLAINVGVTKEVFLTYMSRKHKKQLIFSLQETQEALAQLESYLDGDRSHFELSIDISMMKSFQQRVLKSTLQIPFGQTSTYQKIAQSINNPKAVRAVGQAL